MKSTTEGEGVRAPAYGRVEGPAFAFSGNPRASSTGGVLPGANAVPAPVQASLQAAAGAENSGEAPLPGMKASKAAQNWLR